MKSISVTEARADLYNIISEVTKFSRPVMLTNSRGKNVVMVSEDDWNAMIELVSLSNVPGCLDSITDSLNIKKEDCIPESEFKF